MDLNDKVVIDAKEQMKAFMRSFNPELSDEEICMVTDHLVLEFVPKGSIFLRAGEISQKIGFVVSGALRQFYFRVEKEVNTNFSLEGDFVLAYVSMIRQQPSRYSIQALEDSWLLTYPTSNTEILYTSTRAWERYGRRVAQWVVGEVTDQYELLMFSTTEERYLELTSRKPQWLRRIPLKHLASYLGVESESLSRLRATLRSKKAPHDSRN